MTARYTFLLKDVYMVNSFSVKMPKQTKHIFSSTGNGTTEGPDEGKQSFTSPPYTIHRFNLPRIVDLNIKAKTIKIFRKISSYSGAKDFLDKTEKINL